MSIAASLSLAPLEERKDLGALRFRSAGSPLSRAGVVPDYSKCAMFVLNNSSLESDLEPPRFLQRSEAVEPAAGGPARLPDLAPPQPILDRIDALVAARAAVRAMRAMRRYGARMLKLALGGCTMLCLAEAGSARSVIAIVFSAKAAEEVVPALPMPFVPPAYAANVRLAASSAREFRPAVTGDGIAQIPVAAPPAGTLPGKRQDEPDALGALIVSSLKPAQQTEPVKAAPPSEAAGREVVAVPEAVVQVPTVHTKAPSPPAVTKWAEPHVKRAVRPARTHANNEDASAPKRAKRMNLGGARGSEAQRPAERKPKEEKPFFSQETPAWAYEVFSRQ